MTNDRLRQERGEIAVVAPIDVVTGERNLVFEWDGKEIGKVYELREYSD